MMLVYDPSNVNCQELMTTFWAHYSAEDQSWRDQPLWRYFTYKLHITASKTKKHGYFNKFWHKKSGRNAKNHTIFEDDRAVAVVHVQVQVVQKQDQRQQAPDSPAEKVMLEPGPTSETLSAISTSNTTTGHPIPILVLPELELELQEQPTAMA
jgi:hypothetical protein